MLSRSSSRPVPGGGNRGTYPPEAFGGGGGGGGRGDGDGLHDYRQQLQRYRLGLMFTIASIVMLFISFTTLFVARRGAGKFDPLTGGFQSDWVTVPLPMKLLLINTGVLIVSSILVEVARRAARREAVLVPMGKIPGVQAIPETSRLWAWATAAAGGGFLFGQFRAWQQLNLHGAFVNSGPASTFFFLLTGTHALHLAAGVIVLLY
jgi:cytochrome c oxidase subunit 3